MKQSETTLFFNLAIVHLLNYKKMIKSTDKKIRKAARIELEQYNTLLDKVCA